MTEYKIDLLKADQWNMRGLLRVTEPLSGLSVSIPYFPGYEHKARAVAFILMDLASEETRG